MVLIKNVESLDTGRDIGYPVKERPPVRPVPEPGTPPFVFLRQGTGRLSDERRYSGPALRRSPALRRPCVFLRPAAEC